MSRMVPVLTRGPFQGFPDLFRTDNHLLVVEDPEGQRRLVFAITGSYGAGNAIVGYAPSSRIFVRLEGDIFFDGSFPPLRLLIPCAGHVWEDRKTSGYDWQQCTVCLCPRQPPKE